VFGGAEILVADVDGGAAAGAGAGTEAATGGAAGSPPRFR
jgi:hypothetical protein